MLKSLRTKNFLTHRDTLLEFCPGINVIIGQSNNGKSACSTKSLQLLTTNRPQGGGYLSNFCGGEGVTEIEGEFTNGSVKLSKQIRTNKGGQKEVVPNGTKYTLSNGNTFSDLGDQVVEFLNLSELNIQDQSYKESGRPYLITDTPGEIARKINKITHLDKSDEWLSEIIKKINSGNKEIASLSKQLGRKEEELKKYSDIDKVEALVLRVEKLEAEIIEKGEKLESLKYYHKNLIDTEGEVARFEEVLKVIEYLDEAEKIVTIRTGELKKLILLQDYIVYDDKVLNLGIFGKEVVASLTEIEQLHEKILDSERNLRGVKEFLTTDKNLNSIIKEKGLAENRYREILKKSGRCYACFTKLDSKKIEEMLNEI